MAERPDLEYWVPILDRELTGRTITAVRVDKPVVLRVAVRGNVAELLPGRTITGVRRRAHFVILRVLGADRPLDVVVSPMLAGRFVIAERGSKAPRDLAFVLELDDGKELRYRDDVQMGKVYVTEADDMANVPGLARVGVDVLDPKRFTLPVFRELVRTRRDQAKVFLMDKSALDAMGNAYADEVLFAAGIHPKAMVRSLSSDAVERLHAAIGEVLRTASDTVIERAPPLDEKLRDFLKVRGHAGEPCPRCGATLRRAGVHGHDAFFCPTCQPDGRKSAIVDWRAIPAREMPAKKAAAPSRRKPKAASMPSSVPAIAIATKPSSRGSRERPQTPADGVGSGRWGGERPQTPADGVGSGVATKEGDHAPKGKKGVRT